MSSLFTQCPHCQTSFRVSSAQMNAAHGLVRCGSCLGVFSASANEIRIKHPDGYIVEELEAADELDEAQAIEDSAAPLEAPHDSELPAAPAFIFQLAEPEPAAPEVEHELWHNPDEPHFTLGDLSLDELENESPYDHAVTDAAEYYKEEDDEELAEWYEEEYEGEEQAPAAHDQAAEPDEEPGEESGAAYEPAETLATPARPARIPAEKHALRASLVGLNYDDALDPVGDDDLPELDDVPVTLSHSSGLRSRLTSTLLLVANLLLLLALPLPWLYTHRSELATHPRFSFLAAPVCRYLDCQPAAATAVPATLYSQQLLVRSHPTAANALEVSLVFHNDATAPQSFPALELAFSDSNHQLLANRLFEPDEYLPPELRHLHQMPAHSSMQVQLELVDPGKEAVNYQVELHPLQAQR